MSSKPKKAFSLLETIVTIVIFGFILTVIVQNMLLNIRYAQNLRYRTRIRSELSNIVSLVQRDIRNADYIVTLNSTGPDNSPSLTFSQNAVNSTWTLTGTKITRTGSRQYESPSFLTILPGSGFYVTCFDPAGRQKCIVSFTLLAEATIPAWKITNQVRQIEVSTRNYDLSY